MRTKLTSAALTLALFSVANIVSAHPGHAPTDVVAEVSQPLAGPDHLLAFGSLTAVLLIAFRLVQRTRVEKKRKVRAVAHRWN